jgi:hypothetical protein
LWLSKLKEQTNQLNSGVFESVNQKEIPRVSLPAADHKELASLGGNLPPHLNKFVELARAGSKGNEWRQPRLLSPIFSASNEAANLKWNYVVQPGLLEKLTENGGTLLMISILGVILGEILNASNRMFSLSLIFILSNFAFYRIFSDSILKVNNCLAHC